MIALLIVLICLMHVRLEQARDPWVVMVRDIFVGV